MSILYRIANWFRLLLFSNPLDIGSPTIEETEDEVEVVWGSVGGDLHHKLNNLQNVENRYSNVIEREKKEMEKENENVVD